VQAQQNLPGLDNVTFSHGDLADDTAITVLDQLQILIHFDRALSNHRAVDLRDRSPAAAADDQKQAQEDSSLDAPPEAEVVAAVICLIGHSLSPPGSGLGL